MNEWPTRVRTGVPPCSAICSGTPREVIRLWITVAPGSRASSRLAISAVSTDGLTSSPRSSTTKQRSASPSKARPMSAWWSMHRLLQVAQVLRVDRVGLVVGERAVELEVQRHHGDRQALEHGRDRVAAHAVARVHDDLERPDPGEVDQLAQVLRVARQQVPLRHRARDAVVGGDAVRHQLLDLGQAGLDADRLGAGLAQLDPVVPGRVVAGGDHRAGDVEEPAGVVGHVGRAKSAVDDVSPLGGRAAAEGGGQRLAAGPHVVQGHQGLGSGQADKSRAHGLGHRLVELLRNQAAHVVSLEDLVQVRQFSPASV